MRDTRHIMGIPAPLLVARIIPHFIVNHPSLTIICKDKIWAKRTTTWFFARIIPRGPRSTDSLGFFLC